MKKTLVITSLAILVFCAAAHAQTWSVRYVDGTAEMKSSKGWTALSVGDLVPPAASVRVSQGGSLELNRGTARITIIRDGTYDLAALAKASERSGAASGAGVISQKVQSLTTTKPAGTAVGGVRAADQGSQASVNWVEESDETRSEVASLFAQKKFLDAVKVLDTAMNGQASAQDEQEYRYLTAAAWYGAGEPAKAWRALSRVSANLDAPWYEHYVLLKAQVLVDAADFSGALEALRPLTEHSAGETAQAAWLLTFYCQKGLGDASSAKAALESGYQIDPSSDIGKLIDQQRRAD
ncbi:MAG TPA: hypothetical protein VMV03_02505 [Spirochaetia bacterium]|nr:hypothetical protein [Spirochaetia bacterium]